ncbi:uncharacterized protein N0V89_005720 [Didymosphaeria variabile]|uniref:DUF7605 domain-containing protein n=1 Tax=Didymosphaeria variabile TaxID=1932322 RepID=A0A9W8XNF1_9PLEO|nr:uncharacterized protein N0V89_005720 [Didymosphaeria variabile]KAJ4353988.1 hypothetical protein N0V89_005720 [Didymosphaeria variabile]
MGQAQARNDNRSALHALTATLRHRQDLLLYDIENAVNDFQHELSTLRTNAFAPLRTAFIGQLMDNTYRAANMEHGGGSDQRRKKLVTSRFGSQDLFITHKRMVSEAFRDLSINVEAAIRNAVTRRTALIDADLQLLQDENVVLESEKNPVFRRKLVEEVERAKAELEQMSSRLS